MVLMASMLISQELLNKIGEKYGGSAIARVLQWQEMIAQAKNVSEQEKLLRVNNFFNQHIRFVDDTQLWKTKDYWATPLEFLAVGAGDCEDYSIAKYFTLKELGVAEDKMRLTYVKAVRLNQAHMVLTYSASPTHTPVVLDNLITDIKPADLRSDLVPVYSFNGIGLWLAKKRGLEKWVGHANNLDLWAELRLRMLELAF